MVLFLLNCHWRHFPIAVCNLIRLKMHTEAQLRLMNVPLENMKHEHFQYDGRCIPKTVMRMYQIHVMVSFKSDIEWRKIEIKVCFLALSFPFVLVLNAEWGIFCLRFSIRKNHSRDKSSGQNQGTQSNHISPWIKWHFVCKACEWSGYSIAFCVFGLNIYM